MPLDKTIEKQLAAWSYDEQSKYKGWKTKYAQRFNPDDKSDCTCSKCGETKPYTEFKLNRTINSRNNTLYYSRRTWCRSCTNGYKRKWTYKISDKEYKQLMSATNCEICNIEFKSNRNKFIDHCHTTSKVRGTLCTKCNTMLGMIEKDKIILPNINKYLKA